MSNFLKETKEDIMYSLHTEQDVMFVGSDDGEYRISWDEFKKIANFEYDNNYGVQEIASDLIVYFKDNSWLERCEEDGSEWWSFVGCKKFKESDNSKKFTSMTGCGDSLAYINRKEGE